MKSNRLRRYQESVMCMSTKGKFYLADVLPKYKVVSVSIHLQGPTCPASHIGLPEGLLAREPRELRMYT